ncbi:MAG: hypothetical protein U0269_37865 [Polyangiales bacterium]
MIANSVRSKPLEQTLRTLAKHPARFALAVRAAGYSLGAELHPLHWHRDTRPAAMTAREVETRSLALSDGASIVRHGAGLGLDELRAVIARFERTACAAHRAALVVVAAGGRLPRASKTSAQWPANEQCIARIEPDPNGHENGGVVVLAERNGRRFVLLCSVGYDRLGKVRPTVRVALQVHREFEGWKSTRVLFFPWGSFPVIRAALDEIESQALAETAARYRRAHPEHDRDE